MNGDPDLHQRGLMTHVHDCAADEVQYAATGATSSCLSSLRSPRAPRVIAPRQCNPPAHLQPRRGCLRSGGRCSSCCTPGPPRRTARQASAGWC